MADGQMPTGTTLVPENKLIFEKDINNLRIIAKGADNAAIHSATVEALLLFDIRHLLQEIKDGLVDVESAIEKQ